MKKVLVFAGSNSSESINQQLAEMAAGRLKNCEVNIIKLIDFEAPIFNIDLEKSAGFPDSMVALNQLFADCDGMIIGLPEYNSSMSPVFKNTADWISRIERPTFKNKPVLLLSTSPGKRGGQTNLAHVAGLMKYWGGEVAGTFSLPSFFDNFDSENQRLKDAVEDEKLAGLISDFESALTDLTAA